jgi:starch-binding outer membrane protein, SusD/RagB family
MKQVYIKYSKKERNKLTGFIRMRSVRLFFIAVVMTSLLWSCDFLNYSETAYYKQDEIFYYQDRTQQILNNIYSYLPKDFNSVDGAIRSSATDDAVDVWDISDIQKFNDGSWNSTVTLDDNWSNFYLGIRTANVFIKEAPGLTFPETIWNQGYSDGMKAYNVYPYEARFLRAFYFGELIKRYGNVPLDTVALTADEANKISTTSYDDIVKFIVRECNAVKIKLPVTFSTFISTQTGRATKGAAMALKARTLLYAASPLHNPTNDVTKWIAAAQASKELIDTLSATYTPLAAYTTAFNNLSSKELILERRQADDRAFEVSNTAVGFIGGNTGTCPSQNLVDSYEMKTSGKGISEAGSGYDPANPYATTGVAARDPRLAMTVLYNGAIWRTPLTVQAYYGGLNGPPTANTTKTGYYLKKYLVESISLDPVNPGTAKHNWVIYRYSEVLLNYAEAMNEAYGPDVAGPGSLANLTARAAVNIVRARTGVAMPAFPAGMTQAAFSDKLRNERRVELAFEDHRFWDLRRWKIGPSTTVIRGMNITNNSGVLTFTPKVVETRVWDDRMYLYPIPQTELFINHNLLQNPGW